MVVRRFIVAVCFAFVFASGAVTYATCTGCLQGFTPPSGHGAVNPPTDMRRKINIFIDMGSSTPTKAWNAVSDNSRLCHRNTHFIRTIGEHRDFD